MNPHSGLPRQVLSRTVKVVMKDRLISPGLPAPIPSKLDLIISSSTSISSAQPGPPGTFPLAEALHKVLIHLYRVQMLGGDLHRFFWVFPVADRSQKILRLLLLRRTSTATLRMTTSSRTS